MSNEKTKWPSVNRDRPCPKCGKSTRCLLTDDGRAGKCWRNGGEVWRDRPARDERDDPAPRPRRAKPIGKAFATVEAAYDAACRQAGGEFGGGWTYRDAADENDLLRVVRVDLPDGDKQFRPLFLKKGKWQVGDPPGKLPLYRLNAVAGRGQVWFGEGEKSADTLASMGLAATTTAHGAQSPEKTDLAPIDAADVLIVPDHDPDGDAYAKKLAVLLLERDPARTVKIVRLPGLGLGEDVVDWCDGDRPEARRDELLDLAASAKPHVVGGGLRIVSMADIEARPVDWLWRENIPAGMLTVVAGVPGCGKTFLTAGYMAAIVSRGGEWPDGSPCTRGDVLLVSGEDDLARTLRPRLDAHGADVSRVSAASLDPDPDDPEGRLPRMFQLDDVPLLEAHLRRRPETKLIVIDPISAFHAGRDGNNNAEMRELLSPLRAMAERRGVAIVLVTHLRKAAGIQAVNAIVGSIGLVGAARTAWMVARERGEEGEESDRRLFVPIKNNVGNDRTGFAFTIDRGRVAFEAEPVDMNGDDVLGSVYADRDDERDKADRKRPRDEAASWLAAYLRDGPRSWEQVARAGKQAGHSDRTLQRCRGECANWFKSPENAVYWRLEGDGRTDPAGDGDDEAGGETGGGGEVAKTPLLPGIDDFAKRTSPTGGAEIGHDGPVVASSPTPPTSPTPPPPPGKEAA